MKVKFNAGLVVLLASTCFAAKFRTYFERETSRMGSQTNQQTLSKLVSACV